MRGTASAAWALAALLLALPGSAPAREKTPAFAGYDAMLTEIVRLSNEKRYADAAAILEGAVDAFPDRVRANTYNLAYMRVRAGEPEKAADALELGLSRGAWYGKFDFFAEVWAPLKALTRFARIEERCEARRAEAEKLVKPRLDVVVPPGAKSGEKLPLFIALHGGGENVDAFRPHWTSPLLGTEFVVAFPQSTQLVAPDGFDWMQDVPRTLGELKEVQAKLLREYPVDPGRVVVGGFSSGGAAALEVVASAAFPVAGWMRDTGLLLDFVVTPDIGHWYPPDLAARIDATLGAVVPPGSDGAAGEKAVVEGTVRDAIGWALSKDRARLEAVLTHDDDLFIFHPDSKSTVRGWAAFARMLDGFMDPRFVATRFEVRDLAVTFARSGGAAWFSAALDDCGTWEGRESCWKDARWTGVLEKRDAGWVIVQMHFSFAKDRVLEECPRPAAK